MQLIGMVGLRLGIGTAGEIGCQTHLRNGLAVARQNPLDGPDTGQRTDVQNPKFGQNCTGPNEAVARAGMCPGSQSLPNSDDGPFEFRRDPPRLHVGSC
ncbi:MAG: hypothetical protein MZV64_62930 [Ignavibacteriales bacterium]|nr:hypothetical protein [Ignavibacteriales bacterium]